MYARNPEMEGLRDVLIGGLRRGTQQDMGTRDPSRRRFTFADHVMQVSLLFVGEINQVFVGHGVSSC